MVTNLPAIGAPFVLQAAELAQLFPSLQRRGYQVVGPAVRGSAIVYDTLNSFEELPAGWTAEQEAGHYRLKRRDDGALFGYAVGAQGGKRFLYPAEAGFDLALTELVDAQRHIFLVEAGTRQGAEVLAELGAKEADATVRQDAEKAVKTAMAETKRKLRTSGIREMLRSEEHT